MNAITHGPAVVLRWLAVLVGVLAWLVIVPFVELGRSLARTVHNALPRRPRRRPGMPDGSAPVSRNAVDARADLPRRARSG